MYIRYILNFFTLDELYDISKKIHRYFTLVESKRILNLILQIDSIDIALHLLMCHKESTATLDAIIYDYLRGKTNE